MRDLCAIVGIEDIDISDTITDRSARADARDCDFDEPTISMISLLTIFAVYGKEGKFVSSRHLRDRLYKEVERDVALRVE